MALKRYVGPLSAVNLYVAGHEIGVVEKGSSIVVPDELAGLVAWSEHWEDGASAVKTNDPPAGTSDAGQGSSQSETVNENPPAGENPGAGVEE